MAARVSFRPVLWRCEIDRGKSFSAEARNSEQVEVAKRARARSVMQIGEVASLINTCEWKKKFFLRALKLLCVCVYMYICWTRKERVKRGGKFKRL